MTYYEKGDYMSIITSTKIIKGSSDDRYIIEFPLIDNVIALTLAFERYKFKGQSFITIDNNNYALVETIRFYDSHIDVYIKLLNIVIKPIIFYCQCIGDIDNHKIKNLTVTNIIPEFDALHNNSSL